MLASGDLSLTAQGPGPPERGGETGGGQAGSQGAMLGGKGQKGKKGSISGGRKGRGGWGGPRDSQ